MKITKKRLPYVLLSLLVVAVLGWLFRLELAGAYRIISEMSITQAADAIGAWGAWAPIISVALMLFQAVIAPLPAFAVTAANGLVFGPLWGSVISWIGAMIGALATFMIGRYLRVIAAERFMREHDLDVYMRRISGKGGAWAVFAARLIPFISFDLISYAAGMSYLRLLPFLAATGLGMIPGTILYTFLGHEIRVLDRYSWVVIASLVVVSATAVLLRRYGRRRTKDATGGGPR